MTETNDMKALIVSAESKLRVVAPQWLSVERLTRLALAARSRTPALAECTAESFLLFCMRCAETGLEPIGAGGAWPVPFRNNKTGEREVTFIPDWRGLIWLAKKADQIKHAYGAVVKEGDEFSFELGDCPRCTHRPALKNRGEVIGAYCVAVLPDDTKHVEFMNTDELNAIRGRSKASNNGPWVTDTDAMYIKTVVKRGLKPFAGSPQLHTAIEYDNSALGLKELPERAPLAMPTTKGLPPAGENAPPESHAAGSDVITGTVSDVTIKPGKRTDGTPYTRASVKIEGTSYSTFDDTVGKKAASLKGKNVSATVEKDGRYWNLLRIEAVVQEETGKAYDDPFGGDGQGNDQ